MSEGIAGFHDKVVELQQYRTYAGVSARETIEHPDCAGVLQDMLALVDVDPSISEFYAGIIIGYRKTSPALISEQVGVIRKRISLCRDLGLIAEKEVVKWDDPKVAADKALGEARLFFRMFNKHSPIVPSKLSPPRKEPRTSVSPDNDIESIVDATEADDSSNGNNPAAVTSIISPTNEKVKNIIRYPNSEEVAHDKDGWEYKGMLAAFGAHPLNSRKVRLERDFTGFRKKYGRQIAKTNPDDELSAFSSYAGQFPLLDELPHETFLKRRIEKGKEGFLLLRSGKKMSERQRAEAENDAILGAGAYQTFFECNLRLVLHQARSTKPTQYASRADYLTPLCDGLERAIQLFEPEKGFKFSTYATYWLRQRRQDARASQGYTYKLPRNVMNAVEAIHTLGLKTEEQLEEAGYSRSTIQAWKLLRAGVISMDKTLTSDSDATLGDLMGVTEEGYLSVEEGYDDRMDRLVRIIRILDFDEESLLILAARFGAPGLVPYRLDERGRRIYSTIITPDYITKRLVRVSAGSKERVLSFSEIGKVLGTVGERVRQKQEILLSKISVYQSLLVLSERLNLSEDEIEYFVTYLGLRNQRAGKPTYDEIIEKEKAKMFCQDILSVLDIETSDIYDMVEASVVALNFKSKIFCKQVEVWLAQQFFPSRLSPNQPHITRKSLQLRDYPYFRLISIFMSHLVGTKNPPLLTVDDGASK